MEASKLTVIWNFILLTSVISLFVYIRWYFSTLSSNVRNRLHTQEIFLSVLLAFIVVFVISNESVSLANRYMFFLLTVGIYAGTCLIMLKSLKRRPLIFPKSYLIFHNGKFLKGAIVQNKISEEDIMETLKLKGVVDLKEVDTIILEADGELSVIYKEKVNVTT